MIFAITFTNRGKIMNIKLTPIEFLMMLAQAKYAFNMEKGEKLSKEDQIIQSSLKYINQIAEA